MSKIFRLIKRVIFVVLGLGIVVLVLLIAAYLLWFSGPTVDDTHRTQFNSASWKNEELANESTPIRLSMPPIRLRMVDDLLERYTLKGMSKKQIDELLGIPKPTGYFRDYDYVYWLGPERGTFPIDSEWLVIKFRDNAVVEAKILTD